jgi:integrase
MGIQQVPEKGKPAQYVPYSCRHTFSNMLKNAAGADKDKAALMGHADYETTKRLYQSAELENLQRITDQF